MDFKFDFFPSASETKSNGMDFLKKKKLQFSVEKLYAQGKYRKALGS